MDLLTASHDDLLRLIHELQAANARLTATVARLEARIRDLEGGSGPPQRMPGHKSNAAPAPVPPRPRRPRASNFARRRATPTQQIIHAVEACPTCQVPLAGGAVKRTREVIDLPLSPAIVTEHVYLERCCAQCGRRSTPAVDLAGVVIGQSRLGTGLVALIATVREEARLPYRAIQRLLVSLYGLELSVGGLRGAVRQVAQVGQPALAVIQQAITASPSVNVDETGWREQGRNGYVWTASTPTACRFIYGGRDKAMLRQLLGEAPSGVVVSDFYAVYDGYAGVQQKCWAHLLRDIHDLQVGPAGNQEVTRWAEAVGALYAEAQALVGELVTLPAEVVPRQIARRRLMVDLLAVCQPYLQDESAPQALLCRRIANQIDNLFNFVLDPAVPATNNAAERSLRHLVVSRKISGGTRSRDGTDDNLALASLFTTWRLRGLNPYVACHDLLISPQL